MANNNKVYIEWLGLFSRNSLNFWVRQGFLDKTDGSIYDGYPKDALEFYRVKYPSKSIIFRRA